MFEPNADSPPPTGAGADHRSQLLMMLEAHAQSRSCLPEEQEILRRMITFVRTRHDCFDRKNPLGHITGSAWIVNDSVDAVVLLHHKKLGAWLQPGGHADGESDIARVAMQEAREETGIEGLSFLKVDPEVYDLDIHPIPARPSRGRRPAEGVHFHYDVRFRLHASDGAPLAVSDESHSVKWVRCSEVTAYSKEESVLRMLRKLTLA